MPCPFAVLRIDHQSKLARLLNREIPRFGASEDFRDSHPSGEIRPPSHLNRTSEGTRVPIPGYAPTVGFPDAATRGILNAIAESRLDGVAMICVPATE
jgi:hypothetical protein